MDAEEIRTAFIGQTLDGVYPHGAKWSETYAPDGRIDGRDEFRRFSGRWTITGQVFCTLFEPPAGGACWRLRAVGANCYEFHLAAPANAAHREPDVVPANWGARGWRRGQPATCEPRPAV